MSTPLTLEAAKNLRSGDELWVRNEFNARKQPYRVRVTSVKTWKTRPNEILVGVKYGLYNYWKIAQWELDNYSLERPEFNAQAGAE